MAWVQDTSQSFAINLVGEGIGSIVSASVMNQTTGNNYNYNVGTATWSPSAPVAYPNDSIYVGVSVENTGVLSDVIYAEFVSSEVIPNEPLIQSSSVVKGGTLEAEWSFVIPSINVNIMLNDDHEE